MPDLTSRDELRVLAETLKRVVHLARAYSAGTGTIFENAMTEADRLADRAILGGSNE